MENDSAIGEDLESFGKREVNSPLVLQSFATARKSGNIILTY